jgi:ribonuclease BN (tRNA processing enzyme)
MKHIPLHFIGPIDSEIGPKKMMESLLVPPFFPVHYKKVASHFHYKGLDFPGMYVILYHPLGGQKILSNDEFEKTESSKAQINFSTSKYSLNECLVVKMFKSSHPEQTISYRFEERSTGRIGVILTDHEKQAGLPMELGTHLRGAHFIAMDSQYTEERYNHPKFPTAGFGHATPDYCATTALQVECEHLGLIHHDPESTDEDVDSILASAQRILQDSEIQVSAIEDYQEIVV